MIRETLKWNGTSFRFKNIKRTRTYNVTWEGNPFSNLGKKENLKVSILAIGTLYDCDVYVIHDYGIINSQG